MRYNSAACTNVHDVLRCKPAGTAGSRVYLPIARNLAAPCTAGLPSPGSVRTAQTHRNGAGAAPRSARWAGERSVAAGGRGAGAECRIALVGPLDRSVLLRTARRSAAQHDAAERRGSQDQALFADRCWPRYGASTAAGLRRRGSDADDLAAARRPSACRRRISKRKYRTRSP